MKTLLLLCCLQLQLTLWAQPTGFQALLDSGKKEFKARFEAQESDYTHAYALLKKAVALAPRNTEARYFYGYVLDKMHYGDASNMDVTQLQHTKAASHEFETILQLEPRYSGELFIQDPYNKISSLWGSLAFGYISKNRMDSARWAIQEGKRRGGFIEPILAFTRQKLNILKQNALFFTYGDTETFPVLYLQEIEGFRKDIAVIDMNMIGTSWYAKYIRNSGAVHLNHSDAEIDSLTYKEWQTVEMTIGDTTRNKALTWDLKPTYGGSYILKGDLIALDIIRQSYANRDIYFHLYSDSSSNLWLSRFMIRLGLVDKLVSPGDDLDVMSSVDFLKDLNIQGLSNEALTHSQNTVNILFAYRTAYLAAAHNQLLRGNRQMAKTLILEMDEKFPEDRLPFPPDNACLEYYQNIKSLIEKG